jgi:hypothetical protein
MQAGPTPSRRAAAKPAKSAKPAKPIKPVNPIGPGLTAPGAQPICHATYVITSRLRNSFAATVVIENMGPDPIEGWRLGWTFPLDQQVLTAWGGTVISDGPAVVIGNTKANRVVRAGGAVVIGVFGNSGTAEQEPQTITLNGAVCG